MSAKSDFAFDCETALIRPAVLAPELACVTWSNEQGGTGIWHQSTALPEFQRLLDQCSTLWGANVAFDCAVMWARFPELGRVFFDLYKEGRIRDVQLDQMLLDIAQGTLGGERREGKYVRKGYSLDALFTLYGGSPLDKTTWRLRYGELINVPMSEWPSGAIKYAEDDAGATNYVRQAILEHSSEYEGFAEESAAQARAAFALHLMSCRGIRTDPAQCARVRQATEAIIDGARKLCLAEGLIDAKGKRNTKVARALMMKAAGVDKISLTDTGVSKCGKEKLTVEDIVSEGLEKYVALDEEACNDSGDPALEAYAIYGSAKGLLGKVELLEQGTRIPLQTRFDVLKETGRTSSRAPGPPLVGDNFQNFRRAVGIVKQVKSGANAGKWIVTKPAGTYALLGPFDTEEQARQRLRDIDLRGCVVPRPGFVLCSVDFDAAELRTLGQVCLWSVGQSRLAQELNAGRDPHLLLGAERLLASPLTYDQALLRKKEPAIKEARQVAKVPNFGLPGGLGAKTLAVYAKQYGVNLTEEQARHEIIPAWHETWPEMREYFEWINAQLQDGIGSIQQYVSKRVRGYIPYTVMCNSYFQGLAADAAKSALLPLARECYIEEDSPLFGSRPVLFIHDEVIAEIPEDMASEAGPRMAEIMVENFNRYVPDCPVTASPALMYRWSKEAEPVYDKEGNLQVWKAA